MKREDPIQLNPHPADLKKQARSFGQRCFLANFFYLVPGAVAFAYAWRHFDRIGELSLATLALTVFCVCIVTGIVVNAVMLRQFRCPNCGQPINKPAGKPQGGKPIRFRCHQCDAVWETGLRWHSED
jgi:hypothetical protein